MEKKMYTETLEKVRNDYAVRNIDKLEAAIKAGDMEKALEYYHKAADHGYEDAIDALKRLDKKDK